LSNQVLSNQVLGNRGGVLDKWLLVLICAAIAMLISAWLSIFLVLA
jgi:hypothetical protein